MMSGETFFGLIHNTKARNFYCFYKQRDFFFKEELSNLRVFPCCSDYNFCNQKLC